MNAYFVRKLSERELGELDELYRSTKDPRLRTRAQMVLLSVEKRLKAPQIAEIVRETDRTVIRWLKRYSVEGVAGLSDAPRPGVPPKVTTDFRERLLEAVRRRPRALEQPYSLWTLQRLADYLAEQTGLRVSGETIRRQLSAAAIVLSRPQHKISSPDPEYEVKKRRSKRSATA